MLISNLHQHNGGKKKIPECRVILKARLGTITYKKKSNLHNWHPKFHPPGASWWVWVDQFLFCTQGCHGPRNSLHQLRKCSINDVSPGSEAETNSQRRMWFLNPNGSLFSVQNIPAIQYSSVYLLLIWMQNCEQYLWDFYSPGSCKVPKIPVPSPNVTLLILLLGTHRMDRSSEDIQIHQADTQRDIITGMLQFSLLSASINGGVTSLQCEHDQKPQPRPFFQIAVS